MILYDDKYNFVGMSAHSLSFLGYEDLQEFISMNSDFANLLVPKEGLIYKFENFSWIDFVLYSGSANKSAIVRLKNGQETKIDLTIKEVFLTHPIDGINKFFSIKLISDHFHEISGVPKQKQGLATELGGFSLGAAVQDVKQDEEAKLASEKEAFEAQIQAQKHEDIHEKAADSFVLDMSMDEVVEKPQTPPMLNIPEIPSVQQPQESIDNEDFKLDFFKTDESADSGLLKVDESEPETTFASFDFPKDDVTSEVQEEVSSDNSETSSFSLLKEDDTPAFELPEQEETSVPAQTTEMNLDFLKSDSNEDETPKEETSFSFIKQDESHESNMFLKSDEEPAETTENRVDEPALQFLHADEQQEEATSEEGVEETITEASNENQAPLFNLDFLKESADEMNAIEMEQASEVPIEDETTYKQQDRSDIIEQIKSDIKEIDTVESEDVESKYPNRVKDTQYIIELPQEPQVEQPISLNVEQEESNTETVVAEKLRFDDAIPNFEIEESQNADANKSFTTTLKGLFNKKPNQPLMNMDDESENSAFDFKIKLDAEVEEEHASTSLDATYEEVEVTPSSLFENLVKDEPDMTSQSLETIQTEHVNGFPSLAGLGLSVEEEIDLISDFVSDAKESIESIEQYIQSNDFDKINYSLVKIKSSAEILNLDDIIHISNDMRKHCITENAEEVVAQTQRLKNHIELLESHLETAAV